MVLALVMQSKAFSGQDTHWDMALACEEGSDSTLDALYESGGYPPAL